MLIVQCSKDIEESFISLSFIGLLSLHLEVIALCLAACAMECTIGQCGLEGFSGGDALVDCQIDVSHSIADGLKTNSRPRNTTHAVVSGTGIRLAKRECRERFRRVVPVRSARFFAGRRGGDAQQRGERRWLRPPCGAPFRGCCSRHSGGRAKRGASRV